MLKASLLFLLLLLLGCAQPHPRHYWFTDGKISKLTVEQALRDHPLSPDENISLVNLGITDSVSHHLVQIRFSEKLHLHRNHDLTILVYRGTGRMTVGTNQFTAADGDIIYVPRSVPHRFENNGRLPATAIAVFSPALTSKDFVTVEAK